MIPLHIVPELIPDGVNLSQDRTLTVIDFGVVCQYWVQKFNVAQKNRLLVQVGRAIVCSHFIPLVSDRQLLNNWPNPLQSWPQKLRCDLDSIQCRSNERQQLQVVCCYHPMSGSKVDRKWSERHSTSSTIITPEQTTHFMHTLNSKKTWTVLALGGCSW